VANDSGSRLAMEDLGRFFRHMVSSLAASDPGRLHEPLPLAEIRQTIIPYRANRRALSLETSEDYELVLIRLCAGEGGFARTEPEEAHAEFAAEAQSPNPDLAIVERHEEAVVILNEDKVARALEPVSDSAFAPPDNRYAPPPAVVPPTKSAPRVSRDSKQRNAGRSAAICRSCGEKLPLGMKTKFCPHCGQSQALTRCPECQANLEPGWRHCVNCGTALPSR
jgi:hypothetical protein